MDSWDNWIFLLLSLILSIPIGIFINIVSPSVETYLKNRSLSSKERQIKTLLIRYVNIKNRREYPYFRAGMYHNRQRWTLVFLIFLPLLVFGLAGLIFEFFPSPSILRSILMMIANIIYVVAVLKLTADVRDYVHFEAFKRRTTNKLKKLGCNPRDYGIE